MRLLTFLREEDKAILLYQTLTCHCSLRLGEISPQPYSYVGPSPYYSQYGLQSSSKLLPHD